MPDGPRVLLAGWFSFVDGEATAGDVRAAEALAAQLDAAGICYDTAWSPVFRPGALDLEHAPAERYTHVLFTCGPVHGPQVARLHEVYRSCIRIAVGVTVLDPADPACAGFDVLLPRDAPGQQPLPDLAAAAPATRARPAVPVVALILTTGQHEYGERRQHELVASRLTRWIVTTDCAAIGLDTRLDREDWRHYRSSAAFEAVIARCDVVVSTRLHGMVFSLMQGIPAIAVDPVAGGGKVTAQAAAWNWPGLVTAEQTADAALLDRWLDWALSAQAVRTAAGALAPAARQAAGVITAAVSAVTFPPPTVSQC